MSQCLKNPISPAALTTGRPTPEMFPALRELWRIYFDDPEPIVDLIFQRLVRPETARVLTDGQGRPLSMLFLQPARLRLAGEPAPARPDCAYIYGVGTRPDQRGQGLASRLLEETALDLAGQTQNRVRALALVPAGPKLVGYYSRLGFSEAFSHRVVQLTADRLEKTGSAAPFSPTCRLTPRRLADLADLRDRSLTDSPLALLWERDFLEAVNEECRLYQGEVLHFETPGAEGYLVHYWDGGAVLIKEYVELPKLTRPAGPAGVSPLPAVLAALHRRLGAARYTLRLRPDHPSPLPGELAPFGMIRLLDGSGLALSGQSPGYLAHALD
ncbi:MAG: GNAT family N-acetyltransferase [Deltaproteobacteria bacterium]|jgi:GNAT superfamily N-acetyltransferase|nr:GNAT family N-acetyltransferase [Deltaproteobacteria bacterium]